MEGAWSPPDEDGIRTLVVDVGARRTLRGRRKRQSETPRPEVCSLWPEEWRQLLTEWLKDGGYRRKWETLVAKGGPLRAGLARLLCDELLKAGLVTVEEQRERAHWTLKWIEFRALRELRGALGLKDMAAAAEAWASRAATSLFHPELQELRGELDEILPGRASRLLDILSALDHWIAEGRQGTRRDFALFSTGETKGISPSDWEWLSARLDLPSFGIEVHAPAIWLKGPVTLRAASHPLDLNAVADLIGLTPRTLAAIDGVTGTVARWRIVENRTTFEHAARHYGQHDMVVWVPGFAAEWWTLSIARLLRLCPAPALIACDPDPAGVRIALQVGAVWNSVGLEWEPWGMNSEALRGLRDKRSLSEYDRSELEALSALELPGDLSELVTYMSAAGEKGEQEGMEL